MEIVALAVIPGHKGKGVWRQPCAFKALASSAVQPPADTLTDAVEAHNGRRLDIHEYASRSCLGTLSKNPAAAVGALGETKQRVLPHGQCSRIPPRLDSTGDVCVPWLSWLFVYLAHALAAVGF